jgi:hypothetical protein
MQTMKKRTSKILKSLGGIVIALAIVYAVMMVSANRALSRAHEALKADGRPLTLKDVTPQAIPGPDNAALVYQSVVLRLKTESAGETDLWSALTETAKMVISESPDAEAMERFRRLLDRPAVAQALAEVEAGSRKPGYWNDLDYGAGINMKLPHVEDLLNLSRVLCASARLQSSAGDHAAAWDSALTALRVADALKDEPILICQLVRVAQFGLAIDTIQSLPYSAAAHQEADRLLKACEDPAPFAAAIDGERVLFGDWAFNMIRGASVANRMDFVAAVTEEDGSGSLLKAKYLLPPLTTWDHAAHKTTLLAAAQLMLEPYSPADTQHYAELMESVPQTCVLTRALVPALGSSKTRLVALTARARVTRAGLAVHQQRAEQGAWPDALTAADYATDPFTGKPLIYQANATGFLLYSVGQDLVDDQGKKAEESKGDIVWRYSE